MNSMKTGTLKTLGAAALGVAFAAAAAGTATAAPALPAAAPGLDSLTSQLPVGQVANLAPGGAPAAAAVTGALQNAPKTLAAGGGLLGGLPTKGALGALPGKAALGGLQGKGGIGGLGVVGGSLPIS
jgi:hypothetical protein